MRTMLSGRRLVYTAFLLLGIAGCFSGRSSSKKAPVAELFYDFDRAPVLSAEEGIRAMVVEDGFEVKLVAEEPLVNTPVAMTFDAAGRIWVVEMEGYMPDTAGTGEDQPNGKIVILTDENRDGKMDRRSVFLDSLVLPRAICLIDNGILVAESPNLWFYEIRDDRPVNKVLVDAEYAVGGNVEHQPNGLLRALDNWIYNAKSSKRYRRRGDTWEIEKTHFRGQWGISQDHQGRLFYNTNSENLLGDYFSPGFGAANERQKRVTGFVQRIVPNNRVYPIRPTPGVNRGYMDGILDASQRLVNFTAACGPLIYQGALFGASYSGNAFIAEPSANLIKRNILTDSGYVVKGVQAYANKEFLASKDERFRPVNLFDGPDGALYIVDMYRGIIQHKTYLTPFLKKQIDQRDLTKPLSYGRIYKVVPRDRRSSPVFFSNKVSDNIRLLSHPNGWVRNKAQQQLIDNKSLLAVDPLRKVISRSKSPLARIHALWTLEGLGVLQAGDVLSLLRESDWKIRMQGLSLIPSVINRNNYKGFMVQFESMIENNDSLALPYIAFNMQSVQLLDPVASEQMLLQLAARYGSDPFLSDAIISNLANKEQPFLDKLSGLSADTGMFIRKRLRTVIDDNKPQQADPIMLAKEYPKGAVMYQTICQPCHGGDGNGVDGLAPPLNKSEWVTGDSKKLISIVLYGLTGPVTVSNKVYKAPEINGDMPGIGSNKDFSDDDIAQVISYIRKAWLNKAEKVSPESIAEVRRFFGNSRNPFTEAELNRLDFRKVR